MEKLGFILSLVIILFGLFIFGILYLNYNEKAENKCKQNNGTLIYNELGVFEKCVYNGIEK